MDSQAPLGDDLSNDEIVQRCHDPRRELLGTTHQTGRVVRLTEKTVVKFGWGVTAEEADNQRRAFELLDNRIIRVPEVYRYFSRSHAKGDPESGYLVMEYIHGEVLDEKNSPSKERIEQIAQILHHFSIIRGNCPGPLRGGISRGLLWEENGKPVFKSVQQMERWLNYRLSRVESKLSIHEYPLILCHLNLAPRNIVWLPDGSVCFLDWSSAGTCRRKYMF
jgi:thiamine kinase-like enzyme